MIEGDEYGRQRPSEWERIWNKLEINDLLSRFCSCRLCLDGHSWPFSGAAGLTPVLQHGSSEAAARQPRFRQPPKAAGGWRKRGDNDLMLSLPVLKQGPGTGCAGEWA